MFRYTHGAKRAQQQAGFHPLTAFPQMDKRYVSDRLFELFRNRVPRPSRTDYAAYLDRLGLPSNVTDPFEILSVSGGTRQTDSLEAFPLIRTKLDGGFHCRFFLHGWRHVSEAAQLCLNELESGAALQVALELNNPATGIAVQLQTADTYHMLGWSPRYLVEDLVQAIATAPSEIAATIQQINRPPAPANQRALVSLEGKLPAGVKPMTSEDFQPLAA